MQGLLCAIVIIVVGVPAWAGPGLLPVKAVRYATYDLASARLTPTEPHTRIGDSVWAATQFSGWAFGSCQHGWTVLDWGDITNGQLIGGFTFAYATELMLPERIDVVIMFFADENGFDSTGRVLEAGFTIPNMPARPECGSCWVVTVDLEPAGECFTISGADLDQDGLADFGYTYWFTDLPPGTFTGPLVAGDPNIVPPTAPGIEDAYDAFADPDLTEYVGTYWFEGDPFAQFYLELYDAQPLPCAYPGASGYYCSADIARAGASYCVIDLADLGALLASYRLCPGDTAYNAMANLVENDPPDGCVDLADLGVLLAQYGDDCNVP